MENQRYPADLAITRNDFEGCGWKEALAGAEREGYPAMYFALSKSAREALAEGRNEHGKVLWLLADACSMMLTPASQNAPFRPYFVMSDRRSAIPDDLSDADVGFLVDIVDVVDNPWLKARVADLVWLRKAPRDASFALKAIDAYRSIPLEEMIWVSGGQDCWSRAISLTRMMRTTADDRLGQIETAVVTAFKATAVKDRFFGIQLADLLKKYRLGQGVKVDIAQKLETLSREFETAGDPLICRAYFAGAADWYGAIPDNAKSIEMTVCVAESYAKEAEARTTSSQPSYMMAADLYEKAIQTYRDVPRADRDAHRIDERIGELRTRLNQAGERSLEEMKRISTPMIDITELVEHARKSVSGKSVKEALLAFVSLHRLVDVDKLRRDAMERMKQSVFQSLFGSTTLSREGRVISKRPPLSHSTTPTESDEIAIHAQMIHEYDISIGLVASGDIWPALEVLNLEHRLREADFAGLAQHSPIVPIGRAGLFGKALFAGYDHDFVAALHLLIPQMEHMVRVHLKAAGAKTSNLDKDGIENENGMSTLMELPEAEKVFGKNLAFELRALYCDPFGPNLRNELAHGLLEESAFLSGHAVYAWWLALKLVINAWWNTERKASSDVSEELGE